MTAGKVTQAEVATFRRGAVLEACLVTPSRHSRPLCPFPRPPALESIPLTHSERRVAGLLAWGWSNKEIAHALDRAEATVKNQVAGILRKTGASSRSRFIVFFHTGQLEAQCGDRTVDQGKNPPPRTVAMSVCSA